jgi:hypothetical protein
MTAYEPGASPEDGDVLVYRCTVCFHRFDIVFEAVDEEDWSPG